MNDETARMKLGQLLFELRGMGLNEIADEIYEAVWELKPRIHGIDCVKVPHSKSGMMHAEGDDSPYRVDGLLYCGRCHTAINKENEPLPSAPRKTSI